jgi:hypothetical protein
MNPTDGDGNATQLLMPGTWSLFMNETAAQRVWTLDTSSAPQAFTENTSLGMVYADLEVEIGGKAFWDVDEDDIGDGNEGVESADVTIQGGSIDTIIQTDENGVWRLYVPILENYTVSIEKDGFGVVNYDDNNTGFYVVEGEPLSQDIEMAAAQVTITGTVTDILDSARLDGASIVLYGTAENQADMVDVTGTYAGDELTFTQSVEPGQWVVVVSEADAPFNGGGIAVGILDAAVQDGGAIDLVMSKGGWIDINTQFTAFNLQPFNAGTDNSSSPVDTVVEVEVNLGEGQVWNLPLNSDGTLEVLLPSGSASFSSEFSTVQRDLTMNYTSGISIDNGDEGRTSLMLSYNRKTNSDLTLGVDNVVNATGLTNENRDMMATIITNDDGNYSTIEFEVMATYEGTEIMDTFAVSGSVTVSPDQADWSLEFYNGSAWVDTIDLSLGIGDVDANATMNGTVLARINLPSVEDAWHLENGHSLNVRFMADTGDMTEVSLNVAVPQYFEFNTTEVTETVGVSPAGSTTAGLTINNNGNGDDSFTYEVLDNLPDGWTVAPMNGVTTIAKDNMRDLAFTVSSDASFESGEVLMTVRITSEDGESQDVEITIESARITLSFDDDKTRSRSNNYADVNPNNVVIVIENTGLRTASEVTVYLKPKTSGVEYNLTLSVAALSTQDFEFSLPAASQGIERFDVRVEVSGDDANFTTSTPEEDFGIEYVVQGSDDEDSSIILFTIIALTFIILYFGVKAAKSRSGSGSRF